MISILKKTCIVLFMILSAAVAFAQGKVVAEKKIVQTLEKNKKADVVCIEYAVFSYDVQNRMFCQECFCKIV